MITRKLRILILLVSIITAFPVPAFASHTTRYPYVTSFPAPTHKLDVPFHRQQHALSCEPATLRMLLLFWGIDVGEDSIISKIPVGPMNSDPDSVFVGDINGVQHVSGYGIHAEGLKPIAREYLPTHTFRGQDIHFVIDRLHENKPVIIWGSFLRNPRDASWTTPEGKSIHAVRGEHTFVVTGYAGPRREPTHIFILDPLVGQRVLRTGDFIRNWEFYNNSGLYLERN